MNPTLPYRILVVDDDPAFHEVFAAMLAPASELRPDSEAARQGDTGDEPLANNFPTFQIDFALQGREGLACVQAAMAENRPYTMAFVDVRMPPGWDGIETISHIWKVCFDLQIVICTGFTDFSWHDLIRRFGHSDRLLVLKKPFSMTEVRQVAYSLSEKWDLAHQAQSHLERLQKLVSERTAKLQEANLSLQRKIIENNQAERRLVTQYAVSVALAQATTLANAVEIIFQIVCRSLNWDWGAFWEVDAPAHTLKLSNYWHVSNHGLEDYAAFCCSTMLTPGLGLPGIVWQSGQATWTRDVFLEPQTIWSSAVSHHGLHGGIALPLCAGGKIVGVMEFLSRQIEEKNADLLQTFAVIGTAIGQFIERKQAEEDLRRERDYVKQIIRETPALVVGIAPVGTTTFVNPSVTRHTGYASEELIGRNWWQLFYPGDEFQQVERMFKQLANGPVQDHEMVLTTKDGDKRTVSWNLLLKFDDTEQLTEIIGFGNDMTDRKRAEMERQSMEVQLRHGQKMEAIGQLAAGIAHEINTPTQYIGDNIRFLQASFADLKELHSLQDKLLTAIKDNAVPSNLVGEIEETRRRNNLEFLLNEIPDAIAQSLEGVDRVTHIVRAMKDFSHPGTGEKTPLNLNKAIETTLTVARNEWKYVAKVVTDFDSSLPKVPCYPGEFNQVILNIVVNAAHAITDVIGTKGKAMGVITVSTRRAGDWAEVRIQDTGMGIPEHIREKVFVPFFTTKPVGKGTGQGLAIAHAMIVDRHQGQLTFETEMGAGTTFIIRLPLNPPLHPKKETTK